MGKFDDFPGAVLAEWRGHPVSSAFLEWVAMEADRANYECARVLRKGESQAAMSVAGRAEAFETILGACHRQDPPAEDKPEPSVDPAYRFNPEMARNDDGG